MSNEVKFAVKEKPLLEKVSEFLLPKGFIFADPYGAPLESRHSFYNTDALGLLFKDPEIKPQEHFFGLIKKQRFQWLGTVWLDTTLRDTSAYNENLIFDVYGSNNVEFAKELAKEMTLAFGVIVDVHLMTKEPAVARYY